MLLIEQRGRADKISEPLRSPDIFRRLLGVIARPLFL